MNVNAYCGKELFILEVVGATPLLPEKMTSFCFLLLCCDVEKCTVEQRLDFHVHFETVSEIIGLSVLNLASSYSSFVYSNPRSNSEVFSSVQCSPTLR